MASRYVAATCVALSESNILPPARVERDEYGSVVAIVPLSDFDMEPASTPYYSGLITADVTTTSGMTAGVDVRTVIQSLSVGYSGRLLLWQGVSLTDFIIRKDTKIKYI